MPASPVSSPPRRAISGTSKFPRPRSISNDWPQDMSTMPRTVRCISMRCATWQASMPSSLPEPPIPFWKAGANCWSRGFARSVDMIATCFERRAKVPRSARDDSIFFVGASSQRTTAIKPKLSSRAKRGTFARCSNKPFLARLDLQGEVARIDAALGQASRGEPEPVLGGRCPHVTQLALHVESPNRADTVGHAVAEIGAHHLLLVLVSRRQHDQIGGHDTAVVQQRTFRDEAADPIVGQQTDLAVDDEIR